VERLVKDKSELLEKNHDTQSFYEQQIEVFRNKVSSSYPVGKIAKKTV